MTSVMQTTNLPVGFPSPNISWRYLFYVSINTVLMNIDQHRRGGVIPGSSCGHGSVVENVLISVLNENI